MADYKTGYARTPATTGVDAHAIDEGLRSYMLSVYNYMALGVAFTAVVILGLMNYAPQVILTVATTPLKWVVFAGVLGIGFFSNRLVLTGSTPLAHITYWLYCGLWGLMIAPMVMVFLQKQPALVGQAFAITAVTFGAMSLIGYTTKRNLSAIGTFATMAVIGIIIAMIVNYFFVKSDMFSFILSCGVVLLFSAITAWETQEIKQMYVESDDRRTVTGKAIFGALMLYGSFVTLFIHILNILGFMSGDD